MGLGIPELVIVFVLVVIFFGGSRLPMIGKGLGEGITNFKKGLKSQDELPASEKDDSSSQD